MSCPYVSVAVLLQGIETYARYDRRTVPIVSDGRHPLRAAVEEWRAA